MRERVEGGHHRVTYVELFFDLVFVFAITQISHTLLEHFTPLGVLQVSILFLAVWWVWIFTSWITNWLDPERTPVRVLLFVLMLAGLVLSTSIPKAFEERGLAFGIAFAAMQVGRTAFMFYAVPAEQPALRMNFVRILIWLAVSGMFWIAGGLAAWSEPPAAVGRGACDRIRLACGRLLDAGARPLVGEGLVGRRRPHGRALRAVHHHRARRIDPRHRRDVREAGMDAGDDRRVPGRLRRQPRDVVDLFPQGR